MAIVINLMATFVHNEPTTFVVLNEKGLPEAFLTAITTEIPVSSDVRVWLLNGFPNASSTFQRLGYFRSAVRSGGDMP